MIMERSVSMSNKEDPDTGGEGTMITKERLLLGNYTKITLLLTIGTHLANFEEGITWLVIFLLFLIFKKYIYFIFSKSMSL